MIISAGATDIGKKRKTNQDSIFVSDELQFYIVADGMGGHSGGDIASAIAIDVMPKYIRTHYSQEPRDLLKNGALEVNKSILRKALEEPMLKGMGTTLVSTYFKDNQAHISNVGDSRAYLVANNMIYQLSKDHSLVQEKLNLGIYKTREEASHDKQKNVLVRSVGMEDQMDVDVFSYKYNKHDLFILCSDGLHGRVTDHDILSVVKNHTASIEKLTTTELKKIAQELIDLANHNGGHDNISVVVNFAQ